MRITALVQIPHQQSSKLRVKPGTSLESLLLVPKLRFQLISVLIGLSPTVSSCSSIASRYEPKFSQVALYVLDQK